MRAHSADRRCAACRRRAKGPQVMMAREYRCDPLGADLGAHPPPPTGCLLVDRGAHRVGQPPRLGRAQRIPLHPQLAGYASLSERSVPYALKALHNLGLITPMDPQISATHVKRADRRPNGWDLAIHKCLDNSQFVHSETSVGVHTTLNGGALIFPSVWWCICCRWPVVRRVGLPPDVGATGLWAARDYRGHAGLGVGPGPPPGRGRPPAEVFGLLDRAGCRGRPDCSGVCDRSCCWSQTATSPRADLSDRFTFTGGSAHSLQKRPRTPASGPSADVSWALADGWCRCPVHRAEIVATLHEHRCHPSRYRLVTTCSNWSSSTNSLASNRPLRQRVSLCKSRYSRAQVSCSDAVMLLTDPPQTPGRHFTRILHQPRRQ
jgi:hypothetical protein